MGIILAEETLETFHDSLDRTLKSPAFFDRFYQRFIDHSPAIAAKFAGMDLERIKRMVRDSFYLHMMASSGSPHAIARLQAMAERHAALGITRQMHEEWLDTLIEVVRESDPRCDGQVERCWRAVLGTGVDCMKAAAAS